MFINETKNNKFIKINQYVNIGIYLILWEDYAEHLSFAKIVA